MMQFERIEIRNLRRLREPVCIDGLAPGLNVLAGDNEEGKSTVLAALRCALFDRHNLTGKEAESLQPHNASLRPEVELSFRLDEAPYRLRKAFLQKPEAELIGPDLHRTGPAAEEALRELLAFELPGRGASKPKHQGLWGLLWVEQGTAFQHLEHNDRSRSVLQTTLEAEVGDVLGGRHGQALLERIGEAYAGFYTATGKPRGDYKQAGERVAELEAQLAQLHEQLARYDDEVDRLQRLEADIARFRAEGTLEALHRRHDQARAAAAELAGLQQALDEAGRALRIARLEQETPHNRWTQREALRRQLEQGAEQLAALQQREAQATGVREQAEARCTAAEQALEQARARLSQARDLLERRRAALRRRELDQALAERRRRLNQAEQAAKAAAEARARADALALPGGVAGELRELEQALMRAEAARRAGATRVTLAVEVGVRRDGDALAGDAEFHVAERTALELEGVGRIELEPGGADLAQARARHRELSERLAQRLRELGLRDAAEAEARLSRQRELQQQAANLAQVLAAHAPDGVEALRAQISAAEAELAAAAGPDEAADAGQVEAARQALQAAEAEEGEAGRAAADARQAREQAQAAALELQAQRRERQAQHERLHQELQRAQAEQDDDALYAAMKAADKAVEQAEARREQAEQALARAEPERVELELEAARDAVEAAGKDQAERERAARELRIRLQSAGQREAGEQAAELAGQLTQARARAEHLGREANALRVLHEVLQAAARQARETFLEPVMQRVQPYLKLLMPEAELVLDESLGLLGLRREGVEEPFESLSIGTREQLAIIVRLAFADLLADQGQPVAVILDDALVYADDGRMQRMQLVLRRAAKRFQVLVLTCRERDYLGIGVPIIRLADCRSAPEAAGPTSSASP